ncbi:hydrogenase 3 maturation endopeptidase HyCI [Candidatus Bathyarchaeota archaeon]|nr:hydrogenase 3 maturation endopeptidase HyCI [Candidatus Bathyarchaeota archaeon]
MKNSIKKRLREWFIEAEKVVIAGVGNPIRMDDSVGVKIVQALKGKVSDRVYLIECETVPESYIWQIEEFHPTHILLIDAALIGLEPGELMFVEPEILGFSPAFSTHMLPLRIFCEYLAKTTTAKIGLLLIQPKITDFGEGLSPEVSSASEKIINILLSLLP